MLDAKLKVFNPPGFSGEKYLDPPHTSDPPGAPPARVVHLPSSSPCHQEAKGRGYRKKWIFRSKSGFLGPKKKSLFNRNHVLATTGQSCQKKKIPFSPMNISLLANFGSCFEKKRIFGPFSAFRQNVKTAVSP